MALALKSSFKSLALRYDVFRLAFRQFKSTDSSSSSDGKKPSPPEGKKPLTPEVKKPSTPEVTIPSFPTLNQGLEQCLNKQLHTELTSVYSYITLKAYFENPNIGLDGFARLQKESIEEEMRHVNCVMDLIAKRGGCISFYTLNPPEPQKWGSPLNALKFALDLEQSVYKSVSNLHAVAADVGDFYVTKQLEEQMGEDLVQSLCTLKKYITKLEADGSPAMIAILNNELLQ